MLKSHWIIAVVFGLTLTGSLQAQGQQEQSGSVTPIQQVDSDSTVFSIPVQLIESYEAAASRQREEAERKQREVDSLIVQQSMNTATQAMNEATQSMKLSAWVSNGLVLAGTVLLTWTLLLTNSANRAARYAVTVTREIGQAQVRAYMYAQEVKIEWDEKKREIRSVSFVIANSGTSPAINVQNYSAVAVCAKGHHLAIANEEFRKELKKGAIVETGSTTPSGGSSKTINFTPISVNAIKRWQADEIDIFGYVASTYDDVFRDSHSMEYCVRFVFEDTDLHYMTHFEIYSPLSGSD
jgi:hypothetical protein